MTPNALTQFGIPRVHERLDFVQQGQTGRALPGAQVVYEVRITRRLGAKSGVRHLMTSQERVDRFHDLMMLRDFHGPLDNSEFSDIARGLYRPNLKSLHGHV